MMTNEHRKLVAKEILSLERENGRIYATDLVSTAANPENILHPLFEWDDGEAAAHYRLNQARQLLMRVKATVVTPKGNSITVRAVLHVGREAGYVTLARIAGEEELQERMRKQLRQELETFRARLRKFEMALGASSLLEAIDAFLDADLEAEPS